MSRLSAKRKERRAAERNTFALAWSGPCVPGCLCCDAEPQPVYDIDGLPANRQGVRNLNLLGTRRPV